MKEFKAGMLAVSKAGHDKGRLYVVLGADQEFVYLADGRNRSVSSPKKKKRKHIQINYHIPGILKQTLEAEQKLEDEQIKKAIKEYKNQQEV
ncbi:MAG TPA: KOW domain-containing RNA-binding protein [Candidatus Blautia avicola]|uniref:KOW domain-containing RNA-binding protein n=1 Tax=Candidatus Blautia avicola TaxID=2838483 RepID=A0A9D2QS01_9FIRM|nr:KOW domain-containing RNA-binding protein [Candidatus Blautia avicola]